MKALLTIAFCLCTCWPSQLISARELFSSTRNLVQLLASEERLIAAANDYITLEEERLLKLREKLALVQQRYTDGIVPKSPQYESSRGYIRLLQDTPEVEQSRVDYVGHPVNAYNLIKLWRDVNIEIVDSSRLSQRAFNDRLNSLSTRLPYQSDVEGGIGALLRLQATYELPTNETALGLVNGIQSAEGLTPHDCYILGREADDVVKDYGFAAQWYDKAVEGGDKEPWASDAHFRHGKIYRKLSNYTRALEILTIADDMNPGNRTILDELASAERNLARYENRTMPARNVTSYRKFKAQWHTDYQKLCRGEQLRRDPAVLNALYCRYRTGLLPYVQYKEEIFSFDPRIAIIYEVIGDKTIKALQTRATSALSISKVGDPSKSYATSERISKTAWLYDSDPRVQRISKYVGDITGLSTTYYDELTHAEPFQIVNYGIGGQYEPHNDFYEKDLLAKVPHFLQGTRDRIATFMFYLSSVEAGGSTVFPKVHVRVPAVKGAAAFWFNIKRSGDPDYNTQHAGCPVLLGEKWIANKWIREYGQEFNRPCGLFPEATDFE